MANHRPRTRRFGWWSAAAAAVLISPLAAGAAAPHYHLIRTIRLPGNGFWDYLGEDVAARHVFVPHAGQIHVLNADTDRAIGEVAGMQPGVHAVAVAADQGLGITSDGRDRTATLFNLHTLKKVGQVDLGRDPDAILYDPYTRMAYTFDGEKDATAIDLAHRKVYAHIPLPGRPEYARSDGAGRIYVNMVNENELVAIDTRRNQVVAHWALAPCQHPASMGIDVAHRRVFIGCRNGLLAVVDVTSGKVVATLPIGPGSDAIRFDPELGLIFSSNGGARPPEPGPTAGSLTIVHEDSPDHYTEEASLTTPHGARTIELDPRTHKVFLAVADVQPGSGPGERPRFVPGSFRVLVFAP